MRKVLIHLLPTALRYRSFWPFWLGMQASAGGSQSLMLGLAFLALQVMGSAIMIGLLFASTQVTTFFVVLIGGVLADRYDRRRLIISTQLIAAALLAILATLTLLDFLERWQMFAIAILVSAVDGLGLSARHAFYPGLIDRNAIVSAVVILRPNFSVVAAVATAASGFLFIFGGPALVIYLASICFLVMAALMYRIRHLATSGGSSGFREGLRYLKSNNTLGFLILLSLVSGLFGTSFLVLMPIIIFDFLDLGPIRQSLLASFGAAGGVLVGLRFAYWNGEQNIGLLAIVGSGFFGLIVTTFAITSYLGSFLVTLTLIFLRGIFSTIYTVAIESSIQLMVTDDMRGRALSLYFWASSLKSIGGGISGALAGFLGAPIGVAISGLVVSCFVVGAMRVSGNVRRIARVRMPAT